MTDGTRQIEQILALARWAPSGDNAQNWRFEVVDERRVVVHGSDTRSHCVYDLDGHPSQIALGALLETMKIAASIHGWRMECRLRPEGVETAPTFDVDFIPDPSIMQSPLAEHIERRSVQRRKLSRRALSVEEKRLLEAAVAGDFRVVWFEGFQRRLAMARVMVTNARLRLTLPEAYEVHKRIIEWNARFSEDRVPDQALGAGALTLRIMRFVMASWGRVRFFNRFLAGTWAPRIEMDLIPSLGCAAHLVIKAAKVPVVVGDYVAAGRAVQRFWLTATQLGLQMQPEMTPLIFSTYARSGLRFTRDEALQAEAGAIDSTLRGLIGEDRAAAVWMARIGHGPRAASRSTRLPLERLMQK